MALYADNRGCYNADSKATTTAFAQCLILCEHALRQEDAIVEENAVSLPPVSVVLNEVIDALGRAPQVLLHAPTGAGKSTWLPLKLLEMGGFSGRIILLEPRRLAAKNVA